MNEPTIKIRMAWKCPTARPVKAYMVQVFPAINGANEEVQYWIDAARLMLQRGFDVTWHTERAPQQFPKEGLSAHSQS